jgi:hypothetical protein
MDAPVPGKPAPPITRFDPDDSWQPLDKTRLPQGRRLKER